MSIQRKQLSLVLLMLTIALAGCGLRREGTRDEAPEVNLEVSTQPEPAQVGQGQIHLNLSNPEGVPISDASISIKGDMSHAGMVPVLSEAKPVDPGEYLAEFDWSMPGDWILTITAELPDGRKLVRTVNMNVQGMSHDEMDS